MCIYIYPHLFFKQVHKSLKSLSSFLLYFLCLFMENKFKFRQHTCMANSNAPSLSMHKDSWTISKTKPKIRIIHIFAPEIIKTDVGNFRELVQRLTGKPSGEKHCRKKPRVAARDQDTTRTTNVSSYNKMEIRNDLEDEQSRERQRPLIKEEEEEEVGLCNDENSGGYLAGFSDLEGFISELAQFPLLPLDDNHIQGFEVEQPRL